ncbi:MAG: TFIIB-type zinc ribbon-containing protein [Nitrososphaerales archaeon]
MLDKDSENENYQNLCPNCSIPFIDDYERGEQICPSCGFVSKDLINEFGQEIRILDMDHKIKKSRFSSIGGYSQHDLGLTTVISSDDKDFYGRAFSQSMKTNIDKMRVWQNRMRIFTSEERTLSQILTKVNEVADHLKLPKVVIGTASRIYRAAIKSKGLKNKPILAMSVALLYMACRQCNIHRSLREISKVANIDPKVAGKYYRLLLKETNSNYIPPPSMSKYISKLVNLAELNPRLERLALNLAELTKSPKIISGKSPGGLAAAYIYIASISLSEKIPQREICDLAEVTEVTIRNRCKEILDNFNIKLLLKSEDEVRDSEKRVL